MHFFPDTSEADAAAESYWKEDFKQLIRQEFQEHIRSQLDTAMIRRMQPCYSETYPDPGQFMDRIADMLTVGAENGTDAAFDDIFSAFLTESPLPTVRKYASPLLPGAFPEAIRNRILTSIIEEYSRETVFTYAHKVGYQKEFPAFESFICRVAELVISGAHRGADDTAGRIYRSFLEHKPLRPARRNPRRLKSW